MERDEAPDLTAYWNARLDRLEAKLDRLADDQARIGRTLASQQASLEEHMRRTEAAEERLDLLTKEVAPLKTHVAVWGYLGKILAALATGVGLVATLSKLFGK